jgi:hypothetical protein
MTTPVTIIVAKPQPIEIRVNRERIVYAVKTIQGPPGPEINRFKSVDYAPNLTLDWADADNIEVILTGSAVIDMTGAKSGQRCLLLLRQDAVGNRSISFGPSIRTSPEYGPLYLSIAPEKLDKLGFIYDATAQKYDFIAYVKGF